MFNPTEVPSLAEVMDKKLKNIEVVPGKVTSEDGRFYGSFSIASEELSKLTAREVFLLYLKPLTEAIGGAIIEYADGSPICTKARPLPDEESKVVGFRCLKGKVPVNVYIARRMDPDRHQFIVESHVQKVD
ncbi:MAG: hypothetical protein DRH04_07300 [Deltaproteobacteria bacterium]|nr:MAG: hypothetical protein DRH04_07300 [Deltaproteobacteria bacterium]